MDTELAKTLVTYFYDDQKSTVIVFGFVPYVIYHSSILSVFTGGLSSIDSGLVDFTPSTAIVYGIAVISTAYFAWLEIQQLKKLRLRYFSASNVVDVTSLCANVYLLTDLLIDDSQTEFKQFMRTTAVCLMWVNLIVWLRVFEVTTIFVRLIKDTIRDMKWFFFLYVVIVGMFASMMYIFNARKNRFYKATLYDDEVTSSKVVNVMIHQFLATLGDFSVDDYSNESDGDLPLDWIIFISSTIFINVIIFNMLIAIMGDTYDQVFAFRPKLTLVLKT